SGEVKTEPWLSQGFHHSGDTEDLDDPLEVIGQDGQAHLRPDVFEPPGEEVALVPGAFDGAEWMFGELLAQLHLLRAGSDPALHVFQQVLVGPARNTAAPRGRGGPGVWARAGAGA